MTNVATLVASLELDTSKFRVDSAIRDLDSAGSSAKKAAEALKVTGAAATESAGAMQRMGSIVRDVFIGTFGAITLDRAVGALRDFIVESVKLAREANLAEYAFRSLASQVGASAD